MNIGNVTSNVIDKPAMLDSKYREAAFRAAIKKVCDDHGAEMEVTDDGRSYGMHSGVLRITMMSVYHDDVLVADFAEFDW